MKSNHIQEQLIVFTRYPVPGTTKTRLAKALGKRGAAELHKKLAEHTLLQVRNLLHLRPVEVFIYHEGGSLAQMQQWLGPGFNYLGQGSGDLGKRMAAAFAAAFNQGSRRTVIIGTDCPGLQATHIEQAFESLSKKDLVLGPAADGGYYLIGLNRVYECLFREIPWGSDTVLEKTIYQARQNGLTFDLLHTLSDIDRPEDLKHLQCPVVINGKFSLKGMNTLKGINNLKGINTRCICSIIIPTRNEAGNISRCLPELLAVPETEVIVVDGGSTDDTVHKAVALGARVLSISPGRALQMNTGAEAARGEILIFLHADTHLDSGFVKQAQDALQHPGVAAGAFRLAIAGKGWPLRIIEWLANFRSRVLHMPYGDQGIFLRPEMFSTVGGFPDQPIMEDFELMRKLKRKGRIIILPLTATTSARRWQKLGVLKTTAINQAIIIAYLLGIDPHKLARWYGAKREKG
ncbi:MAG: TIGR04283 family arsenosugar biosynthesis glycosyltransferase [Desulfobulbales bacterium]|nr:TIGR04283 family arsenosugar biosynthesis glycosyltransferase [Desulfobulbales bacterium]